MTERPKCLRCGSNTVRGVTTAGKGHYTCPSPTCPDSFKVWYNAPFGEGSVSFTENANAVRKHIPFAYWLVFDAVLAPVLIWAGVQGFTFAWVALAFLCVSAFFDINEAIVKWGRK